MRKFDVRWFRGPDWADVRWIQIIENWNNANPLAVNAWRHADFCFAPACAHVRTPAMR
jgi:hypothetical protein